MAAYFFMMTGFSIVTAFFAIFREDRFGYNASANGYIFASFGVIGAIVQGALIGPLLKNFTEKRIAITGLALLSCTLFAAISGMMTVRRAFVIGLLVGTCFCVSAKTVLLVLSMALGTITILILQSRMGQELPWARLLGLSLVIAGGAMILPTMFGLFFVLHGGFGDMFYCIFTHNVLPATGNSDPIPFRALKWIGFLSIPVGIGIWLFPRCAVNLRKRRRF
jgi:MFS family permease